ncbi:aldo/keto reductase [Tessaracoccus palaemonis]|uniref:Aldo/keto reductase n=1 Tax=Tessaracoccus palaemonis TaxID=2829499 RepID=A0ABX8SK11_9ACTN|nr:aldo/keto reductase [Tessaracoccus palaemonis]QXT63717.1 aldo/keto reductase [Tessaracoccus palaemonis]
MKTKPLGRTGRPVSVIGFGTAFLGRARNQATDITAGAFEIDFDLGVEALVAGLDAGITLIDTAPFYRTEPIVGEALRQTTVPRDQLTVMTKAGRPGIGEFDFSYDAVKRHVEASLEHLGTDHLDVVSIHDAVHEGVPYIMSRKGAFAALSDLRDEGVVGAIGSACYDPALNADYIETGEFDVAICSASWSMINHKLKERLIPAAAKAGTALLIAEPLERGLLAVGVRPGATYADRKFAPEVLANVTQIEELCAAYGYRILDVGLHWMVREATVPAAIPGAATPEEAIANAAVGDVEISEEFWAELDKITPGFSHAQLGIEIK